ncbi:MAG: PAS domain-containing protein [Candidatus Humimicrobiaceae bacterium]
MESKPVNKEGISFNKNPVMDKQEEQIKELSVDIINTMDDGIYISTLDGRFNYINTALVKMLGYDSKEELLNMNIPKDLYFKESVFVLT